MALVKHESFCRQKLHALEYNNIIYGTPSRKSSEHLRRYKDTLISLHTHTHTQTHVRAHPDRRAHTTNTCTTGDGLVKWQISMQRRRDGFSVLTWKKRVKTNAWHREKHTIHTHKTNIPSTLAETVYLGLWKGQSKQESLEPGFELRQTGQVPQSGRLRIPDRWSNKTERAVTKISNYV